MFQRNSQVVVLFNFQSMKLVLIVNRRTLNLVGFYGIQDVALFCRLVQNLNLISHSSVHV